MKRREAAEGDMPMTVVVSQAGSAICEENMSQRKYDETVKMTGERNK